MGDVRCDRAGRDDEAGGRLPVGQPLGYEGASGLDVNRLGEAYVTGNTRFGCVPDPADRHRDQPRLLEEGADVALDPRTRAAYVTGATFSPDFPTTPGAFDTTYNGNSDAFVTKFSAPGRRTSEASRLQSSPSGLASPWSGPASIR
jgi:hypothetical protein